MTETTIDWGRASAGASEALREGLARIQESDEPIGFLVAVHRALGCFGIPSHRLNLPASRIFGFRHPLYGLALLTWYTDRPAVVNLMSHEQYTERMTRFEELMADSPYYRLVIENEPWYRAAADDGQTHPAVVHDVLNEGYTDYIAVGLSLANGQTQPLGIASRDAFPADLEDRLRVLIPLIAAGIEAFYARYAAFHVVRAYVGPNSGPRALDGSFSRGATEVIRAGILFCDIRNSTALAEELGFEGTVPIFNRIFESVGGAVGGHGGEILKFIGDALLTIFPAPSGSCPVSLAARMVTVVEESVASVNALSAELGRPLAVGFGGHVGDVLYGNIGTPERLDFTVMGPAVNLASRLESLCRAYGVSAVFSAEIGEQHAGLGQLGNADLKGISEPVAVYGYPDDRKPKDVGT